MPGLGRCWRRQGARRVEVVRNGAEVKLLPTLRREPSGRVNRLRASRQNAIASRMTTMAENLVLGEGRMAERDDAYGSGKADEYRGILEHLLPWNWGAGSKSGATPGTPGSTPTALPATARPLSKAELENEQHWEIEMEQAKRAFRLSTYEEPGTDLLGAPGRLFSSAAWQPDLLTQSLNLVYIAADQKIGLEHAASIYPALRRKWALENMGSSTATDQEVRSYITQHIWQQDRYAHEQKTVEDAVRGDGSLALQNPSPPPLEINGELNLSNDWGGGDPAEDRNTNLTDWQSVTTRTYDAPAEPPSKTISQTGVVQNANGPQYSQATMKKLQELRPYVEEHSKTWEVDPFEVMLSIAEEHNTRKGHKAVIDYFQDAFAREGYNSNYVSKGDDGKPDEHKAADIGNGNFAVHNAVFLLKHYEKDPRIRYRETAPSIPEGNVANWLATDHGTSYASAMHFRFYHDRYDPLISSKLTQEQRLRMGVMFFRQGENFDHRYKKQRIDLGGKEVTGKVVEDTMWGKHEIPPS